jgi:hypothetical protein
MMKSIFFFLITALAFIACEPNLEQPVSNSTDPNSEWLENKLHETVIASSEEKELLSQDFAQPLTVQQIDIVANDIQYCLRNIGREIPLSICKLLLSPKASRAQLDSIKVAYFGSDQRIDEMIRTRTVVNQIQYNYSTPGIYYYLITHLGQTLPSGPQEAINYYTLGISANTITFADLNRAGRALYNQTAEAILSFDPNVSDFHYYDGTSNPIIFSGWAFEMVYPDSVSVNGVTYPGPFGSQDGGNVNFVYQFATPWNESFSDINGETLPDFPLFDALWYFPIQGLGAVYVLGTDL